MYSNVDAERTMLGKIVSDATEYEDYIQALSEYDFSTKINKDIFVTIKDLYDKSQDIDIISVKNRLQDKHLDVIDYLTQISGAECIFKNTDAHFKIIKLHSIKKYIMDEFKEIAKEIKDVTEIEQIAEFKNNLLEKISNFKVDVDDMKDTDIEAINNVYSQIEDNINGIKTNLYEYLTGIRKFDNITGGFKSPQFILLGARPAVGKTALALQIAYHISLNNKKVLFISLEMDKEQLIERLFCNVKQVDNNKFKNGSFSEEDLGTFYMFRDEIKARNLIFDTKIDSPQKLRSRLRKEKDIDMVVIDYLQLMSPDSKKNTREQEVGSISRECKKSCREFKIPILALSQLSRTMGVEPCLKDLRESGSLEQDSDIVFFIYRTEETSNPNAQWIDTKVKIAKQRGGSTGTFDVRYIPHQLKFANRED